MLVNNQQIGMIDLVRCSFQILLENITNKVITHAMRDVRL